MLIGGTAWTKEKGGVRSAAADRLLRTEKAPAEMPGAREDPMWEWTGRSSGEEMEKEGAEGAESSCSALSWRLSHWLQLSADF